MKRLKIRCLSVLLSIFILVNSVCVPAMNVQASGALTMTVIEALLSLFGLEIGLGSQTDFFENSVFADFFDAVNQGSVVYMPNYGDVDFSDGKAMKDWITWAKDYHEKMSGNNVVGVNDDFSILSTMKTLDSVSYSNTGSAASNTMRNKIDILKDYYNTATDFVGEVQDAFKVASGNSDDKKMTATRWDIITGMLSCFMCGAADKVSDFVGSLVHPDETVYKDYDVTKSEGYTGAYLPFELPFPNVVFDGGKYSLVGGALPLGKTLSPTYYVYNTSTLGDYKLFALYRESDGCYLPYAINSEGKNASVSILQVYYDLTSLKVESNYISCVQDGSLYLPLFLTVSDAYEYFYGDGSIDLVQNYDSTYADFKDAAVATDDIADMIKQLIDAIPSVDDIAAAMPRVLDKTADIAGTQNAILSVTAAIADIAGIIIDSQVQDNANAQGIIGAIQQQTLDVLDGIQDAMLAAFEAAVVPDFDYWKKELDERVTKVKENASILLLPLSIISIVFGVVVDSDGIGDFILEIPQLEYKGYILFEGYSFNVNEFVQQDFIRGIYDIYILVTDVMIVFWIANFAAWKFRTIIEGK